MYPSPQPGASLLLAFSPPSTEAQRSIIILSPGSRLSANRTFLAIEAGYKVLLGSASPPPLTEEGTTSADAETWHPQLLSLFRSNPDQISHLPWSLAGDLSADEAAWEGWFQSLERDGDAGALASGCGMIVMNDTVPAGTNKTRRSYASAQAFRNVASGRRYFVNVADAPDLSDFSWPTTHRFDLASTTTATPPSNSSPSSSGLCEYTKSPLQLALTTNSSACRLASRLKREVIASLPTNIGDAVLAVSTLRAELSEAFDSAWTVEGDGVESIGADGGQIEELNKPVEQLSLERSRGLERVHFGGANGLKEKVHVKRGCSAVRGENGDVSTWTPLSAQRTRMRYVAQISEYWPLDRLASVTLSSLSSPPTPITSSPPSPTSRHSLVLAPPSSFSTRQGRILLMGTGPGSPLLLTRIAHLFLTTTDPESPYFIDLFLSDKLVPSEILALIPESRRHGVHIAKKYPGNAENAQDELMRLAVEGALEGKIVLRMKQGDPFLFGRGGEELLHFRKYGFESIIIPGLSSSIAGPGIVGIPVTQRGVAESMVICTGVGRGGRKVVVDGYSRSKTLVVLMGVARLGALVEELLHHPISPYPSWLPMALVERASSPDQRVVKATVGTLVSVLEGLGEGRPPGLLVIGWAAMCMDGEGDMSILDEVEGKEWEEERDARDRERIQRWLGEKGFVTFEGLGSGWKSISAGLE